MYLGKRRHLNVVEVRLRSGLAAKPNLPMLPKYIFCLFACKNSGNCILAIIGIPTLQSG